MYVRVGYARVLLVFRIFAVLLLTLLLILHRCQKVIHRLVWFCVVCHKLSVSFWHRLPMDCYALLIRVFVASQSSLIHSVCLLLPRVHASDRRSVS